MYTAFRFLDFSFDNKNRAEGQAKVVIKGSTRFVTPLSIFPTELKALSTWNMIQNIAYSSSFSLFFLGVGIIVQAFFVGSDNLNPASKAITWVVTPIIMVLGIVCFILGRMKK